MRSHLGLVPLAWSLRSYAALHGRPTCKSPIDFVSNSPFRLVFAGNPERAFDPGIPPIADRQRTEQVWLLSNLGLLTFKEEFNDQFSILNEPPVWTAE